MGSYKHNLHTGNPILFPFWAARVAQGAVHGGNQHRRLLNHLQVAPVMTFDVECLIYDMLLPPVMTVGHNIPWAGCQRALVAQEEGRPFHRLATALPPTCHQQCR